MAFSFLVVWGVLPVVVSMGWGFCFPLLYSIGGVCLWLVVVVVVVAVFALSEMIYSKWFVYSPV